MVGVALSLLLASKPQITAWVVGDNPASIKRFQEKADRFSAVFYTAYGVDANGLALRHKENAPGLAVVRTTANKHHVDFYTLISNYAEGTGQDGFDPIRMTKALASEESRKAFANSLVKLAREDKVDGVDLDLESLKASDRDGYTKFASLLSGILHRQGMKLSITVHAKEEVEGTWDGVKAQDYKALGAVADRFNLMTYDFSWSTSEPGPIAPTAWVERVITFTKTQVDPRKIGVGIACYGYDWSRKPATSLGYSDFTSKTTAIDPESGELVDGKLHFSGAEAFRRKYEVATKLGVGSVAFWYCGSEDPKVWDFLPKRK